MSKVIVIGSLNQDLVVKTPRFPAPGETITGESFAIHRGGKGANQAVAAARLGAKVAMVGRVGEDQFGQSMLAALTAEGIDVALVKTDAKASTGVALVEVQPDGENSIVVIPGANGYVTPAQVEETVIEKGDIILLQLEIPLEIILAAVTHGKRQGATIILDPAPPRELPREILTMIDIITPNEMEGGYLSGIHVTNLDLAKVAATKIVQMGPKTVILKLGVQGSILAQGKDIRHFPGEKVTTVDTTAAGDAFAGALGAALAAGETLTQAIVFANRAGALKTTKAGAQEGLPTREAIAAYPWAGGMVP